MPRKEVGHVRRLSRLHEQMSGTSHSSASSDLRNPWQGWERSVRDTQDLRAAARPAKALSPLQRSVAGKLLKLAEQRHCTRWHDRCSRSSPTSMPHGGMGHRTTGKTKEGNTHHEHTTPFRPIRCAVGGRLCTRGWHPAARNERTATRSCSGAGRQPGLAACGAARSHRGSAGGTMFGREGSRLLDRHDEPDRGTREDVRRAS